MRLMNLTPAFCFVLLLRSGYSRLFPFHVSDVELEDLQAKLQGCILSRDEYQKQVEEEHMTSKTLRDHVVQKTGEIEALRDSLRALEDNVNEAKEGAKKLEEEKQKLEDELALKIEQLMKVLIGFKSLICA